MKLLISLIFLAQLLVANSAPILKFTKSNSPNLCEGFEACFDMSWIILDSFDEISYTIERVEYDNQGKIVDVQELGSQRLNPNQGRPITLFFPGENITTGQRYRAKLDVLFSDGSLVSTGFLYVTLKK